MYRRITENLRAAAIRTLLVTVSFTSVFFAVPAKAAVHDAYRWRNDNGSEATATYIAAENTALTGIEKGDAYRLRIGAANSDDQSVFSSPSSLVFASGRNNITASAIDTAGGFAYFRTSAGIVKYDLATDTEVGSPLSTTYGGQDLEIDVGAGFLYSIGGGGVSKVSLASFTQTAFLNVTYTGPSAIDTAGGFLYTADGSGDTGSVRKIDLSTFTLSATLNTSAGNDFSSAAIDLVDGDMYFQTFTTPASIYKVDIGSFTETGVIHPTALAGGINTLVVDTTTSPHYLYWAETEVSSPQVGKIALDTFSSWTTIGALGAYYTSGVIDEDAGFAYFGTGFSSDRIIKVDLSTFTIAANLLPTGTNTFKTALLDSTTGNLYFGTGESPARVTKVITTLQPMLQLEYSRTDSTCDAAFSWTAVGAPAGPEDWVMAPSGNITDGAATTDSAGLANGATTFVPGEIHDTTSITDPIVLPNDHFTEVEYSIEATAEADDGYIYCFRLTDAGSSLGITYTEYAQLTLLGPTQTGTLWRNDDGSESTATAAAAQDTELVDVEKGSTIRLRVGLDGPYGSALNLEYGAKVTSCAAITTWTAVGAEAGPEDWTMSPTANLTNGGPTTNNASLTDGAGAFITGIVLDTSVQAGSVPIASDEYMEVEFAIEANAAVRDGSSYCFRLGDPDLETVFTYDAYAEARLAGPDQNAYRWRNDDGSETTATYAEAENTPLTVETATPTRLRFGLAGPVEAGPGEFSQASVIDFDDFNSVIAGVADTVNGFVYFGTQDSPARILKIRTIDNVQVDSITLDSGEDNINSAVIDEANGFAYFGTDSSPAVIIKVDLDPFSRVGAITLDSGENRARSAVIDTANDFAYFGMFGTSGAGKVVKVDVDPGNFARIGAVTFPSGENNPRAAVIDTVNDFAYFGTLGTGCSGCGTPGDDTFVVKVDIDPGNFARIGSIGLEGDGITNIRAGVIDPSEGFAYFSDQYGTIAKIDLGTFTFDDSLAVTDGYYLSSGAIDTENGYAYFGANSSRAYQIDLATFTEESFVDLDENSNFAAAIDVGRGYLYFGTQGGESTQMEISLPGGLRLEYGEKVTSCSAISSWTRVGLAAGPEDWTMAASANITDGAATTDSAGLTDGAATFAASEIRDTVSQTSEITLSDTQFTEVEFSIEADAGVAEDTEYCFRLTSAGDAFGFTYTNYAEATIGPGGPAPTNDPTLSNAVRMTRLKVNTSSTVEISFELQNELTGTFTATFPVGFTVTGAMTSGSCSGGGTVDTFAFDGPSRTMTAEKHACSGVLTLSGGTVVTPGSPGLYFVTWTNDDPGEGGVAIVDDDQVTVTAQVDSSITFDLDTATTDTESSAPYSVSLGAITTSDTRVSGATDAVNFIWLDLDTNAGAGAVVTVRNANGASGLVSTAVPADAIASADGAVADGTENYGLCSVTTSDAGGNLDALAPFDGTCAADTEGNTVGGFTGSAQQIYDTDSAPIAGGRAQIAVQASISATTPAHNDYTDTLTFIATGTF